ncbi:hypothetical protein [Sutterella megalosphaeroides]|uniref:DUF362 domain-containing protein n=1 Tax=Sutterella megalosphaeroides TaxID=2494234 RepID=A0A2Z6IDL3_9BURK|nr:hypothetical protein [Sutterella megalosphaeroides]BBF23218.1 hypothetical protein SUTMEG_11090 [Sutterella megalosphaeroides]
MNTTRKEFLRSAGAVLGGLALGGAAGTTAVAAAVATGGSKYPQAPVVGSRRVNADFTGPKAKVFFSKTIDAEHLIRLYGLVNGSISGKVAIKLHTGEQHGPNILPRDMVKAFQATIPESTIVETNTLYAGDRDTTEKHLKTLEVNGWTFCPVDIVNHPCLKAEA